MMKSLFGVYKITYFPVNPSQFNFRTSVITEGENARQSNKPPIVLIHGFGASVGLKEGEI